MVDDTIQIKKKADSSLNVSFKKSKADIPICRNTSTL